MFVVTALFQAKTGKEKELEEAFKAIFPLVAQEAGVKTYVLHRSTGIPGRFFFYEQYQDKEAFDYHGGTPYFKDLFGKIKELLADPPAIDFLEEVDAIRR